MNFLSNSFSNQKQNINQNFDAQTMISNNKLNTISLISFNTNGVKRNLTLIQDFCKYDIIFLCETWLLNEESLELLNSLSVNHSYYHCADMLFAPDKGRPYGGRSFIINKKLEILNHDFVNQHIASLSVHSSVVIL